MWEENMEGGNVLVIHEATKKDIKDRRQQHRNVFAERCRLAGLRPPDDATMAVWWPGTEAVFA